MLLQCDLKISNSHTICHLSYNLKSTTFILSVNYVSLIFKNVFKYEGYTDDEYDVGIELLRKQKAKNKYKK